MTAEGPLFNLVLVHPEIPQNSGGIGRLCVSSRCRLHLVGKLGFSLEDKYLKRAGMDYWRHVDVATYPDWEAFLAANPEPMLRLFSTKAERCFWDCDYPAGCFLVFGSESAGLPAELHSRYAAGLVKIPMPGEFHRSLNLANSAAVALYEALRQQRV